MKCVEESMDEDSNFKSVRNENRVRVFVYKEYNGQVKKLIGCATFVQSGKLFILDSSRGYNVFDFGKD